MKKNPLVVILVCVIIAGLLWYAWSEGYIAKFIPAPENSDALQESPAEEDGAMVCAQVITSAINPETKEIREFPTPCDVPEGWEVIVNEVPGLDDSELNLI